MTLIKSISGIRGTIGGEKGKNLTPPDIVMFVSAYARTILDKKINPRVVVGRDGRISGPQVEQLVIQTLSLMGIEVVRLGLSTTPTVEMAVVKQKASGGIIITASHNPVEWNALKFLDENGEFISAAVGKSILAIATKGQLNYADVFQLGQIVNFDSAISYHIDEILKLETVELEAIRNKRFKVVVDCINSTGAISIPPLLDKLQCNYTLLNDEISGNFAHNPEPLENNLSELSKEVKRQNADIGIAVDPDVDRLAFMDEKGHYCGEEYTLVMVADWILSNSPGNTVSNLSSTKALKDITEIHGGEYFASAVGEVNVVNQMKRCQAVIGGEGNGGIIYPMLHYGRDALVGIALLLSALSKRNIPLSSYRKGFPEYVMTKNKIALTSDINPDLLLDKLKDVFKDRNINSIDGVKINFEQGWVHVRKSNTEPIIRLYAEGSDQLTAESYTNEVREKIDVLLGKN